MTIYIYHSYQHHSEALNINVNTYSWSFTIQSAIGSLKKISILRILSKYYIQSIAITHSPRPMQAGIQLFQSTRVFDLNHKDIIPSTFYSETTSFFKNEPSAYVAQALVVMQTEICELKEEVAAMKHTIQTLRSLSLYITISLLQNQSKANPQHATKSDLIEQRMQEPFLLRPSMGISRTTTPSDDEYIDPTT